MNIYKFDPQDAYRFAREQGIKVQRRGDELVLKTCPYCRKESKSKNKFAISLKTGAFNCLRASCGAKGNMITLHHDFGFSLGRDADAYYDGNTKKFKRFKAYARPTPKDPAVEYLESRGISKEIAIKYGITVKKDQENILVFPFEDQNGKLQFIKYRKTDFDKEKDQNKEWCERNCKPILFGMSQCNTKNKTLIMTEGQIDSLSVAEAGIENAVSVPTGAKGFTWVPYCWNWLGQFDELIVFGDYEHNQITLLEEMITRFHGTVKAVCPEDYKGCKDANELLLKFGAAAVKHAVQNATRVEHPRIRKMSDVKRKSVESLEKIRTGIPSLNKVINGFYFGNLIILTGERGQGKSTLGSQFMLQALKSHFSVFFYSGELMDWMVQDWVDRQAAGDRHILKRVSKDDEYVYYSVDKEALTRIHLWYEDRCFIHENSFGDGEEETESLPDVLEMAIRQYGCRVLLIDNLMTAIDDDMSSDLYRQQSAFVRKLSLMAKQYDVLIFLVVHPRKSMNAKFENDDVAGSSNITNLADVILRYSKPKSDEIAMDPCDRTLQVTKNRLDGRVNWEGIKLWFEDSSKRISDDPNGFNWDVGWEEEISEDFRDINIDDEIPF